MLSSSMIKKLSQLGLSNSAARQRIARSGSTVYRHKGLDFANRSQFLYLPTQYKTSVYWEELSKALDAAPLYACLLNALRARGGIMPRELVDTFSGSPKSPLRGHTMSKTILKRLLRIEVLKEYTDPSIGPAISFNEHVSPCYRPLEIKANLLSESILIAGVRQWIRNVGIVSYHKVDTRGSNQAPNFGQFSWDLAAPCYVYPFRTSVSKVEKPKPGFFVCDVILSKKLTSSDFQFFIHKCSILRMQRNIRPFMSMLLVDQYAPEALREGKHLGVVLTTPRNLLGDDVADALKSLTVLLTKEAQTDSPERIYKLLSSLSKIEGAAQNLRGPMFELIVNRLVSNEYGVNTHLGRRAVDPHSGRQADVDIFLARGRRETRAYECKGKEPGGTVGVSEVNDWISRQVPIIRSWITTQSEFSGHELHFEFWTSGSFSPDAVDLLRSKKSKTSRYHISWKDGQEVMEYAQIQNEKRICDVLREQYIKHPLSA